MQQGDLEVDGGINNGIENVGGGNVPLDKGNEKLVVVSFALGTKKLELFRKNALLL